DPGIGRPDPRGRARVSRRLEEGTREPGAQLPLRPAHHRRPQPSGPGADLPGQSPRLPRPPQPAHGPGGRPPGPRSVLGSVSHAITPPGLLRTGRGSFESTDSKFRIPDSK